MEYDVIVVGLGTAGAEAFRTCVECGLRTLGIERLNGMGGVGTIGCISFGGDIPKLLHDYEKSAGKGEVAYEAAVIGARRQGKRIAGVTYVTNGTVRKASAKIVIDSSGNATVGALVKLPLRRGCDFDGTMAPCSRAESWMNAGGGIRPIYRNYQEDTSTDSLDALAATAMKLNCGRHRFWCQNRAKQRILRPSPMVGAREEPRYVTERIQTLAEVLADTPVDDPIFYAWTPEDLPVTDRAVAFESEAIQNWKFLCDLPMFGYPSTISYQTIVVKGVANLLCPSKHFGVAHDLGGGLRMQGELRKAGKVAAFAAKLAIEKGVAVKDVPYKELKPLIEKARTLRRPLKTIVTTYHGYAFEPYSDRQVVEELRRDIARTPEWWFAKSENAPCERSAYAYWTAWKRAMDGKGRPLADALAEEMSAGGRFAANYAVALGLMKDERCVPVLRRLVAEPGCEIDPVIEKAIPNRFKAIALLGRFQDVKSVAPLVEIVKDNAGGFTRDIAGCRAYESADLYRFQALSYALMALRSILSAHPDARVAAELEAWRTRPLVIKGYDGFDLAARLKKVCFASPGKGQRS
ncbi:MAG: FAD-dependent oxidoreductase [Lentisphaerae bacterium]|nr:FAD-dependent oxidoreductase [Lentisphaerota bacterium]